MTETVRIVVRHVWFRVLVAVVLLGLIGLAL